MSAIKKAFAIVSLVALFVATPGCAAAFAALPTIVAAATSAGQVIDAIDSFVHARNTSTPEIDAALLRARSALVAVLSAAKGAESVHDQDLQAALAQFQTAYEAIIALTRPLGVVPRSPAGKLSAAGPNQLDVPPAAELTRELGGG